MRVFYLGISYYIFEFPLLQNFSVFLFCFCYFYCLFLFCRNFFEIFLIPLSVTWFWYRRLLGSRGDAFTFEEVFGERYWYPHGSPAAALHADFNNRLALMKASHYLLKPAEISTPVV